MTARMLEGPGGWSLCCEGGAIHRDARVAVVADLHLGYEWARASGGDCVPAHSLEETLIKLSSLLEHGKIGRLIVAGDLVESHRRCRRTTADLKELTQWLDSRDVELVALTGNHDSARGPAKLDSIVIDGWTIAHGHRPIKAPRTITGHLHPMLRATGVRAPCFLVGENRIILPAFSLNAAGVHVETLEKAVARNGESPLRCLATAGETLLDFGPLPELIRALR